MHPRIDMSILILGITPNFQLVGVSLICQNTNSACDGLFVASQM